MLDQTQYTQALTAIDLSSFGSDNGANQEAERLLPAVYDELRAIASGYLRQERVNHTLQPMGVGARGVRAPG